MKNRNATWSAHVGSLRRAVALFAALLVVASVPVPAARAGVLVVAADEWPTTSDDNAQYALYIRNVASYFSGVPPGKFLIYSSHWCFGPDFQAALTGAGYSVTQTLSPGSLEAFDGVFVGANDTVDRQALADYIRRGGNVYLAGGTVMPNEDGFWNVLLQQFGIRFSPTVYTNFNHITSFSDVPIFQGVTRLRTAGPSPISLLSGNWPDTRIVSTQFGYNWWAIYDDRSLPSNASLGLTLNPRSVAGGASSTATVKLRDPAPAGGTAITLTSANPAVAMPPASVTVPAGSSSVLFSITTARVATTTPVPLSASMNGSMAATTLTVWPDVTSLLLNPASVAGGTPATGTLSLRGPAPDGGLAILLASDNTAAATVPTSIVVPAGATTVSFPVTTHPLAAATTVTISASYGGAAWTATLQVTPPSLVSLTLNPGSLMGGAISTGTVTLSGPAPASGAAITLSSSTPSVAAVPATVTVAAGATTATFSITTQAVPATTGVLLSALYGGTAQSATLTVATPFLTALSLNPATVTGGIDARGTVTVTGIAPTGGAVIALSSDNAAAAAVPASVTIPAGSTTASFTVTTQAVTGAPTVTISASYAGMTRTATLTVLPVGLMLTLQPATVTGGFPSTATLTLSGPAPAGGVSVTLAGDRPAVATFPASVTIPAGSAAATVPVTTAAGDTTASVVVTALLGGVSQTATLTVTPTPRVTLTLDRTSVPGGASATGTITLSVPAPAGGAVIALTSSNPAALVPANVTVAGAATTASFTVATSVVTGSTPVTLTAVYAGRSVTASLTLVPDLPAAPAQLTAVASSLTEIGLSWRDNSGNESGFEIERRTGSASFTRIAAVPANTTAYTDRGLSPNTLYLYRVRAVNASGVSPYSNEASSATPAVPPALRRVIAVFRPATREWFLRRSDGSVSVESFGGPGDQPVPADYLGTGESQLAVFRPTTREWFLRDEKGRTVTVPFGGPDDVPVPADYFGLRRTQIAVYRPATAEWFLRRDDGGTVREPFGTPGDVPVPADYFGFGRAQIAVYRRATAEWLLRADDGRALTVQWGTPGDTPVPGDYLGLGRAQIAVYRPSSGEWFVRDDLGRATRIPYGIEEDVPVPGDYAAAGRSQIAIFRPTTREWFLRADSGATTLIPWGGPGDVPVALLRRDPVPNVARPTFIINGTAHVAAEPAETLTATFTRPDGGVTVSAYKGYVLLHVTGVGQAYGGTSNDAFYLYSAPFNAPQNGHDGGYYQLAFGTSPLGAFSLASNARNFLVGPLPAYSPAHDYTFILDTRRSAPVQLHFGVTDGGYSDNAGEYTISVTQLVPAS